MNIIEDNFDYCIENLIVIFFGEINFKIFIK